MRPRTVMLAVVLSLSLGTTLAACQTARNYSNPDTSKLQQDPEPLEKTSQGIKADYRISEELNKIKGLQGAAVLIKGHQAYVGTHVIGPEKNPDAYMKKKDYGTGDRSQYSGKGIPKNSADAPETVRNGVTQFGQNMQEYKVRAGNTTPVGRTATATGNIDPELKQQIESKVKSMAPGVNQVFITANHENVGQIQGYARYIQDGGSMERFMQDFDETMKRIWHDSSR